MILKEVEPPAAPCSPLKVDGELYSAIVALRNTELATLWSRFNVYLILNGGLLAAVYTTECKAVSKSVLVWAHVFGLALAFIWLRVEILGRSSLDYRDGKVEQFERDHFLGGLRSIASFHGRPLELNRQVPISYAVILMCCLAWVFLLLRLALGFGPPQACSP